MNIYKPSDFLLLLLDILLNSVIYFNVLWTIWIKNGWGFFILLLFITNSQEFSCNSFQLLPISLEALCHQLQ